MCFGHVPGMTRAADQRVECESNPYNPDPSLFHLKGHAQALTSQQEGSTSSPPRCRALSGKTRAASRSRRHISP